MGNNASKQGERERDHGPSSPIVQQGSASAASNSTRGQTRSTSIRRHHQPSDSSASVPGKPHAAGPSQSIAATGSQPSPSDNRMGAEQSKIQPGFKGKANEKSTPVRVPRGADPRRQRGPDSQFEPSGPPRDPNHIPHSNLNFPPRLPLPIEKELHTPGSPIITAQGDSSTIAHQEDLDVTLPRQSSAISNTTLDDDDEETQDFSPNQRETGSVPTMLYWKQGGDKVYVSGTFTEWKTKVRMHKDPNKGIHSALVHLRPGTHYVKFIVDGEMQLSNELPTAADFTNILVNYIEINPDDVLPNLPPKSEEYQVPQGVHPPQVLPQGVQAIDHAPEHIPEEDDPTTRADPVFWGKELPQYLHDVEKSEGSNRYARSVKAVNSFNVPPGLPMFLGKSILNGATPMKDDASVLNMPNHTVLNHLATSSIRQEVLATSITTRYIRKYVTTIVYKPTEDES